MMPQIFVPATAKEAPRGANESFAPRGGIEIDSSNSPANYFRLNSGPP